MLVDAAAAPAAAAVVAPVLPFLGAGFLTTIATRAFRRVRIVVGSEVVGVDVAARGVAIIAELLSLLMTIAATASAVAVIVALVGIAR